MTRRGRPITASLLALTFAACSADGRELADPVVPLPATTTTTTTTSTTTPTTTTTPTSTTTPTTTTTLTSTTTPTSTTTTTTTSEAAVGRVVFDRLHSPANATAEVTGTGAVAGDPVTVDGRPGDVLSFEVAADGGFTARIRIEDEGAHTVCVADACGRVYTLAPDAETPEEVVAKIDEAITLAADILPYEELFPDWTIEIGGALSGTGGTTDPDRRVVTVYRNRGRTVDDFVRTILHEFGHVVDAERLDDRARAEYVRLAGYPDGTEWRDPEARRLDDWARQPAEDFAEVLVAAWTDRRWSPRTRPEVGDDLLAASLALAGFPPG